MNIIILGFFFVVPITLLVLVDAPINFDDQFSLGTVEIRDEWINRMLAPKFVSR